MAELNRAEQIKQMICPKCGDRLKEFTVNDTDPPERWVECVNYYCRWEKRIDIDET